ncbi:MAG: histidine phosphatase family protein [Candidatus Marinimicrobia bacterium]|nr:histidine phosphatase family protein [Candidatus Neomarinimicrobiota bacterium]
MTWYFVRHGEIESNIKKVYAGWSEEGLTRRGIQQAKEAAKDLIRLGIDAVYCSPLQRAVQTAEIIGKILGKQPISAEDFKEMRLGPWEGRGEEEISRDFPEQWKSWNTTPAELVLEGRETLHELLGRVLDGIARIKARTGDKSVLIVTHVAIIRVLLLHSQGMDLNLYKTIPAPPNGKVFEIRD